MSGLEMEDNEKGPSASPLKTINEYIQEHGKVRHAHMSQVEGTPVYLKFEDGFSVSVDEISSQGLY